jgi:hypothetical protein
MVVSGSIGYYREKRRRDGVCWGKEGEMVGDGTLTCGGIPGEAKGVKALVSLHGLWKKRAGRHIWADGKWAFVTKSILLPLFKRFKTFLHPQAGHELVLTCNPMSSKMPIEFGRPWPRCGLSTDL